MINEKQLIETLKNETAKDPALSAVLHVFASRERARDQVTVSALAQRMTKEGFTYDNAEYVRILRLLAQLGVGRLDTSGTGKVRALKDVKITLQSLGMAGVGNSTSIEKLARRNRFQRIPIIQAAPVTPPPTVTIKSPEIKLEPANYGHKPRIQPRPPEGTQEWMVLCVKLSTGEVFKTYIPKGLSKEDATLIGKSLLDMAK